MRILKLELINYQQFSGNNIFVFKEINLLKGKNGVGKTNLLNSIRFALYGYTGEYTLKDLISSNKKKKEETKVILTIEKNDKVYEIERKVNPSEVRIRINGEEILNEEDITLTDKNLYLIKEFGTLEDFNLFRFIDAYTSKEVNFLEKGTSTIKRILFKNYEGKFNKVRDNLLSIKYERDKYCKENIDAYNCYPSKKRYKVILEAMKAINKKIYKLKKIKDKYFHQYNKILSEKSKLSNKRETDINYYHKMKSYSICPVCRRSMPEKLKKQLLRGRIKFIKESKKIIQNLIKEQKKLKKILYKIDDKKEKHSEHLNTLQELKMKLESRFKTNKYIYSKKDVEIVKQALQELEFISSRYLQYSIKTLEPLINDILKIINYKVNFNIDEKGRFTIYFINEEEKVKRPYKKLSTGQKLIIQIAIKIAILLHKGEEGIIIIDEGMSSLDKENLDYILEIFNELPFQLFIVLHNVQEFPSYINIIDLDRR